jgi:hypothetical protein
MIQRIQSVYLAVAGIITFLLFCLNISIFTIAKGYEVSLNALGISPEEAMAQLSLDFKATALTITTALSALFSIVAIFLYSNRAIQMRIVRITIVLLATIVAQSIINTEEIYKQLQVLGYERTYSIGFILPIISIILHVLAFRGIKKDEALIKSMDRIR